jgi:hypothetical protein
MIRRELIEIREPADRVWNHAAPMTPDEIRHTLADPDAWVYTVGSPIGWSG